MTYIINLQSQFLPSLDRLPHLLNRRDGLPLRGQPGDLLVSEPQTAPNSHAHCTHTIGMTKIPWASDPTPRAQRGSRVTTRGSQPSSRDTSGLPRKRQTGRSILKVWPCASPGAVATPQARLPMPVPLTIQAPHFSKQTPVLRTRNMQLDIVFLKFIRLRSSCF